ncbi:chondroitinase-B domain-containing protein [Nonlabens sp. Asnod2-A12]|uniref:chondroitinase-B domain-containing protein n=1 Tax=Nonlabens sp. Asnod2-A12 TaxID=3160578 RepID=UPI00386B089D
MISRYSLLAILVFTLLNSFQSLATDYTVNSVGQFNALNLQPCDVVTWTDGTYSNQNIIFNASGTLGSPIVLKAQTPGGVIFNGSSEMNIYGDYLIVDGFYWNGGVGTRNHVEFRRDGSSSNFANNSVIRNCTFNNLATAGDEKSRWIVLYGTNNTVENCTMMNKNTTGVFILVELSHQNSGVAGHIIRNNYFYNVPPKDGRANAGDSEGIRIGSSGRQFVNAGVLVEGNYFQDVDGESEIISNKSLGNTYRNNTFRSCRGSLVLRHGAGALVEGNYFLGENKSGSGGIRVIDQDHIIINNYMQGLNNSSSTFNGGIIIMGGDSISGGTSNSYQFVTNVLIAFNTIYNSDDPIYYNSERATTPPQGIIANNLIYSTNGTIVSGSVAAIGGQMTYQGNIFGGSNIGITNSGITNANANFSPSGEIFKPSTTGPAVDVSSGTFNQVSRDIEGFTRPSTNKDVGAHEIVGATGMATNPSPIIDAQVGNGKGSCYINAIGTTVTSTCSPIVTCAPVSVTGLSVNPTTATVQESGTIQVSATVTPSTAANQQVNWSSSDTTIAIVDASGVVTGVAAGNATITATTVDGGFTTTSMITVTAPLMAPDCLPGTNLALNASVDSFTNEQVGNEAINVIDGNDSNRWSAMTFPQSMVIDLGEGLNVSGMNLFPFSGRDYQYVIEGSTTSATSGFTTLVDRQANTTGGTSINDTFNPTVVRYVKLTVTGAATYTGPWVSISDLEIICGGVVLSNTDNILEAQISIYPNPFKNQFTIDIPNTFVNEVSSIKLVDLLGKVVYESDTITSSNQISINSSLTAGMYFIQLTGDNNGVLFIDKVIKQ